MTALAALQLALGERSLLTIDDIAAALGQGRAFLWHGARSTCFVAVNNYESAHEKVAEAGPAAGDVHEILAGIPEMERLARLCDCTQAHVTMGREGWSRELRALGYEPYSMTMRKFL